MSLAKETIILTKSFPEEYRFNLVSQMMRSAISISSNIAEGSARTTEKEFMRFLDISQGSACELESQFILTKELDIIDITKFEEIQSEINSLQKMIRGFRASLGQKSSV